MRRKAESAWVGPVLGVLLSLIQADDANPEEFENRIKKCNKCKKNCKPCIPPVSTLGYREDTNPSQHHTEESLLLIGTSTG
jgi:hypothetical protein